MMHHRKRAPREYVGGYTHIESRPQHATPNFPFKKMFMSAEEIAAMFRNLATYTPEFVRADVAFSIKTQISPEFMRVRDVDFLTPVRGSGSHMALVIPPDEYSKLNNISDYFNEHVRMQCRKSYAKEGSPLEWWTSSHANVRAKLVAEGNIAPTLHDLREAAYTMYPRECETFKPSHLAAFIRATGARSVLDISAGWGDRLAACLATGCAYTATDPNSLLHDGYARMIAFYEQHVGRAPPCKIKCEGFERAIFDNGPFDLMLTSPPYFDLENYTLSGDKNSAAQSTVLHTTLDTWFNGFLIPCMRKAFELLRPGGWFVINIEDDFKNKYVDRMIRAFSEIEDSVTHVRPIFIGTIVAMKAADMDAHANNGRPFFVWRKNA